MQYDLNLQANGAQRLEVNGRFFKYISGAGKIRVTTNKGAVIDLVNGQGVWGEEFASLTVQDRSGAFNPGVLLAGSYDFRDDSTTLSGVVAVNIPPYQRTNSIPYGAVWSPAADNSAVGYKEQIVTPAQNVNGIVVHEAFWVVSNNGGSCGLLANVAQPANAIDGDVIAYSGTEINANFTVMQRPGIIVPAGKGLWLVCSTLTANKRQVFYTLL